MRKVIFKLVTLGVVTISLILLISCGQSGRLYLPEPELTKNK